MAGLQNLPRTSPYWIRRVAFSNPASSGPNALRLAVQSLTASTDAPRSIALNRSSSSAILSYCYSTSTKPSPNTPASAFTAPQTPDCSNETIAAVAAAAANTAAASTYAKMDPHEVDKESKEGLNDWKLRPPYQMHKKNDGFHARYHASCHCGKVEYELSREEPLDSKLCHCTTCQTQHGMHNPSLGPIKAIRY